MGRPWRTELGHPNGRLRIDVRPRPMGPATGVRPTQMGRPAYGVRPRPMGRPRTGVRPHPMGRPCVQELGPPNGYTGVGLRTGVRPHPMGRPAYRS